MKLEATRAPALPESTYPADWPEHLLRVGDLPCVALEALVALALEIERDPDAWHGAIAGETLACFAAPPTTGLAVSTSVAAGRLGMLPVVLARDELAPAEAEPIADEVRRSCTGAAALFALGLEHDVLAQAAAAATVPLLNGRSDQHHPCQALADLVTLRAHFGRLEGLVVAFVGDARDPTVYSLMDAAALCAMDLRLACPADRRPPRLVEFGAQTFAALHGGRLTIVEDPADAVRGADAVYTRAWPAERGERSREELAMIRRYKVRPELMALARPGAVFMHALPARRGEEVSSSVIDGRHSVVWRQAANRIPAEQAALYALIVAHRARQAG